MMDKAKAYDEALERARQQRNDYQKELDKTDKNSQLADILRAGISAIELAFPELTESEDEKIRKSLIEFLTDIKEISESGRSVWAVRKEDAEMCKSSIAYLEKQKERVPENEETGTRKEQKQEWSEEDETLLTNILIMLKEYLIHHYSKDDIDKSVDWLENRVKFLRPSWKPSEEQMEALHTAMYLEEMQFYGGLKDKLRDLYEQLKKL